MITFKPLRGSISILQQPLQYFLPVISLNKHRALFHRSAGAADILQLLS